MSMWIALEGMRKKALPAAGSGLHVRNALAALSLVVVAMTGWSGSAQAQQVSQVPDQVSVSSSSSFDGGVGEDGDGLPQAPAAQAPVDQRAPQTKRILGVIPNFRAVSTDEKLPPQSVKDKFVTATQESFDYSSLAIPAALAGYSLARDTYPEFGSGGVAYGRYLWHSVVDQTSENYWVEFIVPALTHEDTRYYTLYRGSSWKRFEYAITRIVITRSDSGKEVFNASEVIGSGAAAGLSNAYYPSRERSVGNTVTQWGTNLGVDAASFLFKEFWPDVNKKLFHGTKPDAPPLK